MTDIQIGAILRGSVCRYHKPKKIDHRSPIIDALIKARVAWRLSSRIVASRAGVGDRALRLCEMGQTDISFSRVEKWAAALGYELVLRPKSEDGAPPQPPARKT
jgi:hypothetical protein